MRKEDNSNYKGWNVHVLENRWMKLHILPEIGGRIIQAALNGHEFLYVNPLLAGSVPDSTRLGENGAWLNFGGEKIWPAPQGWDSPDQWPGPPDPVLDGGPYACSVKTGLSGNEEIILTSPFDQYTGLQITRRISVSDVRSEAFIHATFSNKSDRTRCWSVWPVCQVDTSDEVFPNQYQMVCPINPESKFPGGYKVMHGLANNPQIRKDLNGNLVVDYQYIVGKVGLDTHADWLAFLNKKNGKVFVMKFRNQGSREYPDGTNVQIWITGRGIIWSRNKIREFANDRNVNHPYMEMELLSPLEEIKPGESTGFNYRMMACTIPPEQSIVNVNETGVISEPLKIHSGKGNMVITGKFGVFSEGKIKLHFRDASGSIHSFPEKYIWDVSPLKGCEIKMEIDPTSEFRMEGRITADLYDLSDHYTGELDSVETAGT